MKTVRVWSLTVDADEIGTSVFGSEQECYESLKANFWNEGDPEFDISTTEGTGGLIDWLTSEQGVVLYIEEHDVEVPA